MINALKGKKSAPTSPVSGFTRGVQKIKVSPKIMMLDTPGVLPHTKPKVDYVLVGAITPDKIADQEGSAGELITTLKGAVERYYGVHIHQDCMETLEEIALKKKFLLRGGKPDTRRMAEQLIRDVQSGKIRWGA